MNEQPTHPRPVPEAPRGCQAPEGWREEDALRLVRLLLEEIPTREEIQVELPTLDQLTGPPEPLRSLYPLKYWFTHRAEPMLPPAPLAKMAQWPHALQAFVLLTNRQYHSIELITDLGLYVDYLVAVADPAALWTAQVQRDLVHRLYVEEWPEELHADALADAWRAMAEVHIHQGELKTAAWCLDCVLRPSLRMDLTARAAGEAYLARALLCLLQESYPLALVDLDCAHALFARDEMPLLGATALVRMAFVHLEQGHHTRAAERAKQALSLFTPETLDSPVARQAEWVLDTTAGRRDGKKPFAPGPVSVSGT